MGIGERIRITKTFRTRAVIDIPLGVVNGKHAKARRVLRVGSVHTVKEFTVLGHMVLTMRFTA